MCAHCSCLRVVVVVVCCVRIVSDGVLNVWRKVPKREHTQTECVLVHGPIYMSLLLLSCAVYA